MNDLKKELPKETAMKIGEMDFTHLSSGELSNTAAVFNVERRNFVHDKHVVFIGENFLRCHFTQDELKAVLAEIAHVALQHSGQRDAGLRLLNDMASTSYLQAGGAALILCIKNRFSLQPKVLSMFALCALLSLTTKLFSDYSQKLELQV